MSTTSTVAPARHRAAPSEPRPRPGVPAVIGLAVAAAVAVNLAVWGVGELAGGSFEFTDGDKVNSAAPGGVVLLTAVPLVAGLTLAAVLARRWSGVIRVAQVVGSVLAVATIGLTLGSDFDTPSTIALAATHLTLVPVLVVALARIGERR